MAVSTASAPVFMGKTMSYLNNYACDRNSRHVIYLGDEFCKDSKDIIVKGP